MWPGHGEEAVVLLPQQSPLVFPCCVNDVICKGAVLTYVSRKGDHPSRQLGFRNFVVDTKVRCSSPPLSLSLVCGTGDGAQSLTHAGQAVYC